jgi:predicted nuclease of restriction endonuclease-like (RecB) superfamily
MDKLLNKNDYNDWLAELKSTIRQRQIKAALAVNSELIHLYWDLGSQIVQKQENAKWGTGFIDQLSKDLKAEFPEMSGFSGKTLRYCRAFFLFYSENTIWQQLVAKLDDEVTKQPVSQFEISQQLVAKLENPLFSIPWGHHILIMQKVKNQNDALFYIQKTIENNWSRAVLEYHIETQLHSRQGKAITNFINTLPAPESDLAQQIIKDPYNFEFLTLAESAKEKDLERELISNISKFLLELGKGFAYLGNQFTLKVGKKEYRLDLLFYHIHLRRYVVIELKLQEFQPEFVGKLNFYISAINEFVKTDFDHETIGILLCKNKDNFEVEFTLKDSNKPIGVSEFKYKELPQEIKNALPTPQELENQLKELENQPKNVK